MIPRSARPLRSMQTGTLAPAVNLAHGHPAVSRRIQRPDNLVPRRQVKRRGPNSGDLTPRPGLELERTRRITRTAWEREGARGLPRHLAERVRPADGLNVDQRRP